MNIVRCRLCRTYINPFVYFVDSKMWKCNLCYRVNERKYLMPHVAGCRLLIRIPYPF